VSRSALLIGQGLAGTILGWELLRRGWQVHLIDHHHQGSSSLVAGGLWNPISFRTHGLTWRATELLEAMENCYPALARELGQPIYQPLPLLRVLSSAEEANRWDERMTDPALRPFLADSAVPPQGIHAPFGVGEVKHAGWVDVPALLTGMRDLWLEAGILAQENFDESALQTGADGVHYRGLRADVAIWCSGWQVAGSRAFSWLPVVPNKGEILTFRTTRFSSESILNFGQFILPLGGGRYRAGATWKLGAADDRPTEQARQYLLGRLQQVMMSEEPEVIGQASGFRPTVPDRRPLMGSHPHQPRWHSFNGFGSRGVMLVPAMAVHYADVLEEKASLHPEVNLERYRTRLDP